MSRIEKAIEIANLKRSQQYEIRLESQPVPGSEDDSCEGIRQSSEAITIDFSNPYLVTANDPTCPASEQYRKLKSMIVKLSLSNSFDKALMVTSSIAGEGKTITSLNLAITLAQEFNHTVLLVESDIRRPTVMSYLGLHADRGLTDCVLDGIDLSEVLVKTAGAGHLTILPAGRQVENPVELFSSNKMIALFEEIKSRYNNRYVVVDTTPLLPFAEPAYIANMIGAVLMVVREGVTTPDKLKRSLEMIKENNLLGVVSNGVSHMNSIRGNYDYYGYR